MIRKINELKKRTRIFVVLMLVMAMMVTAGCSNKNENNNSKSEKSQSDAQSDESDSDTFSQGDGSFVSALKMTEEESKLYDEFFSLDSNIKISIDITDDELKKLERDYESNRHNGGKSAIYRMCDMTITVNGTDYEIPEVGIRMKGNTSRTDFYNSNDGVYNLIHLKVSFTETFDNTDYYGTDAKVWNDDDAKKEREDRRFASLKGLEIKWNREVDGTYTRETYAYKMYRDFGLLAPNNNLCQCIVNDKNFGVLKVYEPVDKVFIKRNFDEENCDGDLYKCTWGNGPADYREVEGRAGVKDESAGKFYTYDLKTNKKKSGHEDLTNFINTINSNDISLDTVEEVLDVDYFVKFMAVSYFLGMPDDMRNNYNNHYVYFRSGDNKAVFIAYDCDLSLGIEQWNPTGSYMTQADPYAKVAYGAQQRQGNKLIRKSLSRTGFLVDEYTKALDDVMASKWLTIDNFKSYYEKIEKNYSAVVVPDIRFRNLNDCQKTMSIDDTYMNGTTSTRNKNMQIEEYFERIKDTYKENRIEDDAK